MDLKERIIMEVQQNPMLFDKANPNYKRTDLKDNIWCSIGEKLGMSSTEVQAKWRNIRDCMVKCMRKNRTKSGHAASSIKPYKYEHILGFLIPTLLETSNNSNVKTECDQDYEDESWHADGDDAQQTYAHGDEMEADSNEGIQMAVATPGAGTSTPILLSKNVHGSTAMNAMDTLIMDYIKKKSDERPNLTVAHMEDDDIMMFLKSLAPTIRKFPPRAQAEVRFSISKIIHDAEMEYLYK